MNFRDEDAAGFQRTGADNPSDPSQAVFNWDESVHGARDNPAWDQFVAEHAVMVEFVDVTAFEVTYSVGGTISSGRDQHVEMAVFGAAGLAKAAL